MSPVFLLKAGIALLVIVGVCYAGRALVEYGSDRAISTIERANDVAEAKADSAMEAVERCYAGGGRWNRFERLCDDRPGQQAVRRDPR